MHYLLQKKSAFSLIEVVIATSILSLSVFGVYKLIWENIKLMNRSDVYLTANHLFPTVQECVSNKWFAYFKMQSPTTYYLTFWTGSIGCMFWTNAVSVNLDNIEYTLQANITNSGSNFIDFDLSVINEDTGTLKQQYFLTP